MSEIVLELKDLTKRLGKKNVVDHLSLQVKKGEIFGLLGPNGAGKTTTIRMIVGLISKTSGEVSINGVNVSTNFEAAMEHVGAIVENPEMYKFLTGWQNLVHYARMASSKISDVRMKEVVKLVELEDAIHKKVKTYSLGMRQRLGVAQALLHQPSLLILDEPTNGLDPQGIHDLRAYLKTLTKQGISVVVSSHLLSEMQLMCDRFAIIKEGKLVTVSTVHEEVDKETTFSVSFEVGDVHQAQQVIKDAKSELSLNIDGQIIELMISREQIAEINSLLVTGDVSVFGIQTRKQTLEDRFLEITKSGEDK